MTREKGPRPDRMAAAPRANFIGALRPPALSRPWPPRGSKVGTPWAPAGGSGTQRSGVAERSQRAAPPRRTPPGRRGTGSGSGTPRAGCMAEGSSPDMCLPRLARAAWAPARGWCRSTPACRGGPRGRRSSSAGPTSTSLPRYMTPMVSAMYFDDGEVVGDEDVGQVAPLLQLLQQIQDLRLDGHIERGDRLVGDDQLRVESEGPGEADPLALAAGELVRDRARAPSG